jgi:predicted dehydrogenase
MCHTLAEADQMVKACVERKIPLCCGAITTTHPSFARAKQLVRSGALGEVVSMEAAGPVAQHQNWSYFLDSPPAWVTGTGDSPRRETGSDEFTGQGILVAKSGLLVHFRSGAPGVRITGTKGEMCFSFETGWQLSQDIERAESKGRVAIPWPRPQFLPPYGAVYSLADVIDSMEGRLDEPKNSGRRVAIALEVEIALKLSSKQGGARVELPLADRTLGLNYDWFR